MNTDIVSYYHLRAREYEKIYLKPERQNDLLQLANLLQNIFRNKDVFEIACGTGYWTERIAKTATQIFATDVNDTVLEIAKAKSYSTEVSFERKDIFHLKEERKYASVFGGFIWSHIPQQKLAAFIDVLNNLVEEDGIIMLIDNNYVEGSSTPVAEKDKYGNTYQLRKLEDGTMHKVLKNFPDENFLKQLLKDKSKQMEFIQLDYFWLLKWKA